MPGEPKCFKGRRNRAPRTREITTKQNEDMTLIASSTAYRWENKISPEAHGMCRGYCWWSDGLPIRSFVIQSSLYLYTQTPAVGTEYHLNRWECA